MAHRRTGLGQHMRMPRDVGERHRVARRERMVAPHERENRRTLRVFDTHALLRRQAERQTDVGVAVAHAPCRLRRRHDPHREIDARVARLEACERARQEIDREAFRAGDLQQAAVQRLQPADFLHHMLGLQQAALRETQQPFAGLRQRHPARPALEQRRTEFALELRDLPADRRDGHVQPRGCVADRPGARHFDEIPQRKTMQESRHRSVPGPVTQAAPLCLFGKEMFEIRSL
ncbi:hypothetical protein BDI4_40050 [Burkholderia diffusa]|nr:hypothetical protein BDI4_40050 [Burkholderia diffusa]